MWKDAAAPKWCSDGMLSGQLISHVTGQNEQTAVIVSAPTNAARRRFSAGAKLTIFLERDGTRADKSQIREQVLNEEDQTLA